jgi:pimeloyl-ACP methyl ester carboxylesterase
VTLESLTHPSPREALFIHGAGGNSLLWKRTLNGLSGPGTAHAINLPGHPDGAITCTTVVEYSESVHGFIHDLGVARPAVCGHSMGGAVALQLAIDHPEDLSSLILVDTGAKLGVDERIVAGLRAEPMKAIEGLITPMSFFAIDLDLGREARAALSVPNLPVFLNDYLACDGFDVRAGLPHISARTLVVSGESDRMTPPRWAHYLREHIAGAGLFFVRGSGHMLPLEKPAQLAAAVQAFLA